MKKISNKMSHICRDCWTPYKTEKMLNRHTSEHCSKYKNILFTCQNCNFYTKGIKQIEDHIKICDKQENNILNNQFGKLQEKYNNLKKEYDTFSDKINDNAEQKEEFDTIKKQLLIEKTKNKIYQNIIEHNTNIKLDDILSIDNYSIKFLNPNDTLKLYIYENFQSNPEYTIINNQPDTEIQQKDKQKDKEKVKKEKYRVINKTTEINIDEEFIEQQNNTQEKIDRIIDKHNSIPITIENVQEIFVQCFKQLSSSKFYTKILNILQKERNKVFNLYTLETYKELIQHQVQEMENIFKAKKYSDKKIQSIVIKGLSPLEARLINYNKFYELELDIDEIDKVKEVLQIQNCESDNYTIFDPDILSYKFMNYSVVLIPLEQLIEIFLYNRKGYNNLVFVPLPKNCENDPFSFYSLEYTDDKINKWKIDTRLESITNHLQRQILPYMISLFRNLYKQVFSDNDYREKYTEFCPLTKYDCEQLLHNIIKVSDQKVLSKIIKNIIKSKFMYKPTENDKFNLSTDDILQKKRLQEQEDIDLVDIVRMIFDGISTKEAVDFLRYKNLL